MKSRFALAALVALAVAGPGRVVRGQDGGASGGDGTGADSAAADSAAADSSRVSRPFLSTDGAVDVFEETTPGEGLDGFWWEYDSEADLERLLDKDRRDQQLDRLTDAFGFDLVIPDSIRALRDSVSAVADSIRAVTIEFETSFNPTLKTNYSERRDDYTLSNEFISPIPLTERTTLSTRVKDSQQFNESTRKVRDDRNLSSTFTFRYSEKISTTLTATRNDSRQRRDEELETENGDTSVQGRAQASLVSPILGTVDLSGGLSISAQDYKTRVTTGESGTFRPTWTAKASRPHGHGTVSLDYSGSFSRGNRKETHPEPEVQEDGSVLDVDVTNETNDVNRDDKLALSGTYKVAEGWDLRMNSAVGRERVQFIAQSDSILGQQETRTGKNGSVRLNLDAKPVAGLQIRAGGNVTTRETNYDLETAKFARTQRQSADTEFRYDAWPGANLTTKFTRAHEDRDYRTPQAGNVDKQSASLDYRQTVTGTIDLNGSLFISLDNFAFDDAEANTADRDLFNQRGTFTVRYNPKAALSTSVKMEARETQSISLHPSRSGDNKTDFTYLITPSYILKLGAANISGNFTADARYAVFDFDEDRNSLTRRFGTRQRWQQAFTSRLSTEVVTSYDFTDEGNYASNNPDGVRLFSRNREIRRFRVEAHVQYSPYPWLRSTAVFRQDGDDTFGINDEGEKSRSGRSRTNEFTTGFTIKRDLMRTIKLDLGFSRTEKVGDRVTEADRRFLEIRAALEYQPFQSAREGAGG